MERRLFDFFNGEFEKQLDNSQVSMQSAFNAAKEKIERELQFTPYVSFDSFNRLRKARKKRNR